MIVNEHIRDFLFSLDGQIPRELEQFEAWALKRGVPVIKRDTQSLLRFIIKKEKPEAILEIGTAVGFSTLYMLEFAPSGAHITTIEKVEMRLKEARKRLGQNDRVTLIEADADEALGELASAGNTYDMIFLDAAKGQYISWLPVIIKLLRPGGLLVTDNVLLEGSIAESKFSIERRDRTIHKRMREYLHAITHSEMLESVVLPVGDGISVSYRKEGKESL